MDDQHLFDSELGNYYYQAKIIEIDKLIIQNQKVRKSIEQIIPALEESLKEIQKRVEILQKDLYCGKSLHNHSYNFIFCNIKNPLLTYFMNSSKTYGTLNMDFIDDEDQIADFSNMDFEDFSQISQSEESSLNLNYDIKVALKQDNEKQKSGKKKFNYYADIFAKNNKERLPTIKKRDPETLIAQIKKENYDIKFYEKKRNYVNVLQQKQQIKKEEKLKKKQIEQFLKLNWTEILNQEILKKFKETKNLKDIDYIELSDYLFKKQNQNLFKVKIPGVELYKFVRKQIQYKSKKQWTKEKQKKLIELNKVTNPQSMSQISLYFEEFEIRDCVKQYAKLQCQTIKWKPNQDFKLIFGVLAFKASWSRICVNIFKNEKNQMQCRERFANVLNPKIIYEKLDRQSMLEVIYRNYYGQTWAEIEKYRFSNTTDNQLLRSATKFKDNNSKICQFIKKLVKSQQKLQYSLDFDRDKLEILKFDESIKKKKIEENKDEKDSENYLDKTTKETVVKRQTKRKKI